MEIRFILQITLHESFWVKSLPYPSPSPSLLTSLIPFRFNPTLYPLSPIPYSLLSLLHHHQHHPTLFSLTPPSPSTATFPPPSTFIPLPLLSLPNRLPLPTYSCSKVTRWVDLSLPTS